jgi:hypothetical protein
MQPDQIITAALALSRDERARLAARLLDSLSDGNLLDPAEAERLGLEEVERRRQRYLRGETKLIPAVEALASVRTRLRRAV